VQQAPITGLMIDPIHTASAADASRLSPDSAVSRSTAGRGTSFANVLARAASTAPGTVRAETRPDNEQTTKVANHPYSRVENGADKGRYLNQVDGSPREGAVFKLVERADRVLHVYGTGKDKVIVAVMTAKDKDAPRPPATGGSTPVTT
jgi:hypothetical protein